MSLRGKRILITAGPVWVPIDRIRVISNISTGETGILLAKEAARFRADVTLILGPSLQTIRSKSIKVINFRFYDELKKILKEKIKSKNYDILIHCAAVSDYRLRKPFRNKLSSDIKNLKLRLKPTEKLADFIKNYDPKIFLIVFKLEFGLSKDRLLKRTYNLLKRTGADLVVGNNFDGKVYRGYILDKKCVLASVKSKQALAKRLIKEISKRI